MTDRMLGVYEIAKRTGLAVGTVQVYSSLGKLPPPDQTVNQGRTKLWTTATIDRWNHTRGKR